MDHGEAGQGTPFDSMSHEEMLAWLDVANSGAIQGASDRLVSAAKKIREIAEELRGRPQTVEWKGEGADAFRTWSADLVNSTLRLGDYSEGAAKWLARASDSLASAQVSIPRTHAGAQANLDAALEARNDPDASAVAQKSAETLIAAKEANRQEAAAEMRKLAQSYALSASQMDGLERPTFPPPPGEIVPSEDARYKGVGREFGKPPSADGPPMNTPAVGPGGGGTAEGTAVSPEHRAPVPTPPHLGNASVPQAVGMEIAGAAALPDAPSNPSVTPPVMSGGKSEPGPPSTAHALPPGLGGSRSAVSPVTGGGKPVGSVRPPIPTASGASTGTGGINRPPRDSGIVGGRPAAQVPGREGIARGTVVGGEGTHAGRAPMGQGMGTGGPGGARSGNVAGRRLAGEAGGVVGGRPQQTNRSSGRPFTPGGTGLVRGTPPADGDRAVQAGRGGAGTPQRPGDPRRDGGERPDYLVEDEETWLQGGRRVVPPVID